MNFSSGIFGGQSRQIDVTNCDIVFVADLFVEDYVGGAELTTEALIKSSPYKISKVRASDVTIELIRQGAGKLWLFGNFASLNPNLIPVIASNLKYSVLEYDYKFCKLRSPEKHVAESGECSCAKEQWGQLIAAFYRNASIMWWMSQAQLDRYLALFPALNATKNIVLSSVFEEQTLDYLKELFDAKMKRSGWIVLGSNSWVKGFEKAEQYCKSQNLPYEVVWNIPYEDLLQRLASAEGFVYLPNGADTCPRMVIEAALLGCDVIINGHVQHATETWFANKDRESIDAYLRLAHTRFWTAIKGVIEYRPTISGYMTTLNCVEQGYPFEASLKSLMGFCDEIVVVDGGSRDGTWEILENYASSDERIVVHKQERDWANPRFAVFDGQQKALARSLCTRDFCWQMDSDEVVHENDYDKIRTMAKNFSPSLDLLALPVIEYWGGFDKVRMDINSWKWRLSRNKPYITHGIPASLRRFDSNGQLYSAQGSDGCDYVRLDSYEPIPFAGFVTNEIENVRGQGLSGNNNAVIAYEQWFNSVIQALPSVYHFSWFDLPRKIKTYKNYWTSHWNSLFNQSISDTASNNMMFDCPWSEVTDEMIADRAKRMASLLGGWVWHRKWDGVTSTPHIKISSHPPRVINDWVKEHAK